MKQFFLKITSFEIAFIVLFSTFSFTINEHYCGDLLKDRAFLVKTEKCEMEMDMETSSDGCNIHKKKCCDDLVKLIDGQDELQLSVNKISFDQQLFIVSFVSAYSALFEITEAQVTSYDEYLPPLVVRELYKLDETYLI
tara:strand:- start:47642 stop:48058 length:417 start_codon:yes stop_codon:yes gene_type:complete